MNLPKIAANESEFLDSLFKTCGTFDGFVRRVNRSKRNAGVHFRFMAHELCANGNGVICYVDRTPEGKPIYRYTNPNEWPFDFRVTDALYESLFRPLLNAA